MQDPNKGWDLSTRAEWLSWNLDSPTEHTLLMLRAHGSSLQRHRQPSRWNGLHYDELFCPLCMEHDVHTPENSEHMLTGCMALGELEERERLDQAAQEYFERHPIRRGPKKGHGVQVKWHQMTPRLRTVMLLGNPPVGQGPLSLTPDGRLTRSDWAKGLVVATAPHIRHLLRQHNRLDKAQDVRIDQADAEASQETEEEG